METKDPIRVPLELRSGEFLDSLRNRLVVSLDMNVWIDLAEGATAQAQGARDWFRAIVEDGLAFFPLTASLIWELYRQEPDSALRVADTMDKLSLGACFAPLKVIRRREVLRYVAAVVQGGIPDPLSDEDLFIPVGSYLGSNPSLSFPAGWSEADIERCARGIEGELRRLSLCDLVRMRSAELPHPARPAPAYREVRVERAAFARGSAERGRLVEEDFIARRSVQPLIEKLPEPLKLSFMAACDRRPLEPEGLMGDLQRSARALRAEVETHFETGRDHNRRDRIQDFFDIEFLIVPRAYSDVLASRDRQIRHLMEGRLRSNDGPMFAASLPELRDALARVVSNRAAAGTAADDDATAHRGPRR